MVEDPLLPRVGEAVAVGVGTEGEIEADAFAAGAGAVWFQLGVVDESAAQRVVDSGATMIMDTCPLIEWRRRGQ